MTKRSLFWVLTTAFLVGLATFQGCSCNLW
jgi:hypothetical protein